MVKSCAYGQVNREMITNLKQDVKSIKDGMKDLSENFNSSMGVLDSKLTELFNHQSNRLPMWATVLFTIGGSILTGLSVWIITH